MTLARTSKRTYLDAYDMMGVVSSGRRMAEERAGTLEGHVYDTVACVFELLGTSERINTQADLWFQLRAQFPHLFGEGGGDGAV